VKVTSSQRLVGQDARLVERVIAVLPALDEEATIEAVVRALPRALLEDIIVVDNGSTDRTAELARAAGATVVAEPQRGYGAAVLTGIAAARAAGADVIALLDADGSDPAELLGDLLSAITQPVDMVLGIRDPRRSERGSLLLQQRLGNALAVHLMRAVVGARYADLPPFKVIRAAALERLQLRDRSYGFTIELLLRAHQTGLRVVEVPVPCRRRRGGTSKVSGTVRGTLGAGTKIISAILRHSVLDRTRPGKA